MFKEIGLVEKYGSGIRRIVDACEEHGGCAVSFSCEQHGFKVVVAKTDLKKVGEKGTEKVGEKVGEKLTENQKKIIANITASPYISATELAEIIGISKRKTEENLSKLKAKGILQRIGPDKGGHWQVVKR